MGKRILLTTIGTYGDFSPYLVMAKHLKDAGHTPIIATQALYQKETQKHGIEFIELGGLIIENC